MLPPQRSASVACLALAVALLSSCGPPQATFERTIVEFATAVQEQDFDRLFCLMTGAAESEELGVDVEQRRRVFEEWARDQYDRYEIGRDEGFVELTGHGITLVKLLALGSGTYAQHALARPSADGSYSVISDLRFGYRAVDLSAFSPGTTFYLTGPPVGTVHAVVVPRGYREVTLDVLETLQLSWTLVSSEESEACPAGWTVAGVEPVADSAVSARLTWEF